ncbi:MAG TPA: efflux RND transporter periplasmic adaptor subunit [Bryobacteraceae bacterium]|jgi:RND family efflux transporter MFP subunit|nr:efflux RND transporter periplasmic adaptor subunit [Bryobacteraceae bacterium]
MKLQAVSMVLFLSLAACQRSETSASNTPAAGKAAIQTPTVATVRAITREVSATVQATGSFVAHESSDVAPNEAGIVVTTLVDVGDFVQQGQVIARLDDRDAKLRIDQARAAQQQAEASVRQAQSKIGLGQNQAFDPNTVPEVLAAKAAYESAVAQQRLAQADSKRYENLVNSGDVSRSAYDKARTQVETADAQVNATRQQYEASLNAARQNYQGVATQEASQLGTRAQLAMAEKVLADAQIRAPFAGYVSARPVTPGEYVSTSSKIATILRVTPIKLELQVPELYAQQMKRGLSVGASVTGYAGRVFQGSVTAINPAVDPNSRTFIVEVTFANGDVALRPGMFATARIVLPGSTQGIYIPQTALITDATTNSSQVFLIRDGKARLAVVQVGERDGDLVRILTGIPADAVLAIDHLQDLYDGQSVKVAEIPDTKRSTGA